MSGPIAEIGVSGNLYDQSDNVVMTPGVNKTSHVSR